MVSTYQEDALANIKWPENPPIEPEQWQRGVAITEMLCGLGNVTHWVWTAIYPHVPQVFLIDGLRVSFLPHYSFLDVAGELLKVPETEAELKKTIQVVRDLERLRFTRPIL